jgi:hypothetical protein
MRPGFLRDEAAQVPICQSSSPSKRSRVLVIEGANLPIIEVMHSGSDRSRQKPPIFIQFAE